MKGYKMHKTSVMIGTNCSKLIFLIFSFLVVNFCYSQAPEVTWEKVFRKSSINRFYSGKKTPDGGLIGVGETYDFGGTRPLILKTDQDGNFLWLDYFDGTSYGEATDIEVTSDGCYIVAAQGRTSNWGDIFLLKYDNNGNLLWSKQIGSSPNEDARGGVEQTSDGGFVIAGSIEYGWNTHQAHLLKTDFNGDLIWQETYGLEGQGNVERFYSVKQSNDGGYILVGSQTLGSGNLNVYIVKTDAMGNQLWEKNYGKSNVELALSVLQTIDGGFIMCGFTNSIGFGKKDGYILKIDQNGNIIWEKTYGGPDDDEFSNMYKTDDGNFVLTGYSKSFSGNDNIYIVKIGENGDIIWQQNVDRGLQDRGCEVIETYDGGFAIFGYTGSDNPYSHAAYLVRLDHTNQSPTANAGLDQTYEADQPNAANVQLNGSGSNDPDGDLLTYTWRENGEIIAGPTSNEISNIVLSLGVHEIELTIDDGNGGTDADTVKIEVVDTKPPELTVELDPTLLWPPNHKMKTIMATVFANDICDPNPPWTLISIESNEPEEGPGKKNYPDIEGDETGTADTEFMLRAERLGNQEDRVYTVTYQVVDASGNVNFAEATVLVPHDMGNPLVFDPNETEKSLELVGNYPNPFNPETEIYFNIAESGQVKLIVFNTLGQKIKTLVENEFSEGSHTIRWDGTDDFGNLVSGGLYLCRMQTKNNQQTIRMLFLK